MILFMVVMLLSLIIGVWVTPKLMKGLKDNNMVVLDYYKKKETWIPSKGGMVLLFTCALSITVTPILIYGSRQVFYWTDIDFLNTPYLLYINYIIMLSILTYGIFGMVDDYFDIGRPIKALLPLVFVAPLILFLDPTTLHIPLYGTIHLKSAIFASIEPLDFLTYRVVYRFMIIPLYIMVCANLVNMHSGFNGLATGTSLIVISTLILRAFIEILFINGGSTGEIVGIGAFMGGLIILWIYNYYPSKIFEGNTGSMMIGAAIGITIAVQGYLILGFICLIPHTFNFLLYVYWRIRKKLHPENRRFDTVKWGGMRDDGTLEVPNALTLKWILPKNYRMNEKQVVWAMYALTGAFCLVGLVIDIAILQFKI